jgi:hypothetical protein
LPGELPRSDGIEHAAELEADKLYEVVALAVARFRRGDRWATSTPGPGCEFKVKGMPDSPVTHTVTLRKVENFALHGTGRGPKEILRRADQEVARAESRILSGNVTLTNAESQLSLSQLGFRRLCGTALAEQVREIPLLLVGALGSIGRAKKGGRSRDLTTFIDVGHCWD